MAALEVNSPDIDTWQPPCEGTGELSMDSPTSVIVMTVEDDGSVWVIPKSERQIFDTIVISLQGLMPPDDLEPVTVNQTCAAFFSDGNWYRARVMTTEPEITVHFIDLGITSMVAADEITALPSSVTIYPPLATKIALPIDCQLQPAESDLLTVMPISKREDVTMVDVIEQGIEEDFSKTLIAIHVSESSSGPQPNSSHSSIHSQEGGMSFPCEQESSSRVSTLDDLSSASRIVSSEGSNDCSQMKETFDMSENVKSDSEPKGHPLEVCITGMTVDQFLMRCGTEGLSQGGIPEGCASIVQSDEAALSESQKNPLDVAETTSGISTDSAPLEANNSACDTTTGRSIPSSNLLESTSSLDSNEQEMHPCSSIFPLPDSMKTEEEVNSPPEEIQSPIAVNLNCVQVKGVNSNEISHWKDQDNLISDECSSSGSRSGMSQDCDPFISALGRYPHLGGGYGPSHTDSYDAETYQNLQEPLKYIQGNLLTQSLSKDKPGSCNDDDADWQSFSTSSSRCSDIKKTTSSKQKGRNQPNVDRSLRVRSQHHPPNVQSGNGTASGTCADDGSSMNVKSKLDFELAILREQNRLQMLQMQKQMDEHVSRLTQQLDGLRDEVMGRIAVMGNEMSNRLLVINESVIQKMAQFYSDIASLKNAQVLNRQLDGRELTSNHSMKQAQNRQHDGRELTSNHSMKQVQNRQHDGRELTSNHSMKQAQTQAQEAQDYGDQVYFQQRQQNQYGSSGRQLSSQNSHIDRRQPNSHNRQQTGEQQYQHPEKERNYCGSSETPVGRLSSMRSEKMTEQELIQRQHLNSQQQQHLHQQLTTHKSQQRQLPQQEQQQQQQNKWQEQQHLNHQSKHFNGRGTYSQPSHTPHSQNNFYPKDHFNPNDLGKVQESDWGKDGDNNSKTSSGCVICVANFDCKKMTPDILFNLFGVYGNVMRVKISSSDKEQGFVEMADAAQAEACIQYLNGVMLMGQPLQVTPCSFQRVLLTRPDISSKMGKDYSKQTQNRFHRFKPGTWNSSKMFPPSDRLMITNILRTVSEDKIKETFAKKGFNLLSVTCFPALHEEKKYAFVSLSTVEEALAALVEMHLTELSDWMQMKISFAKPSKNE